MRDRASLPFALLVTGIVTLAAGLIALGRPAPSADLWLDRPAPEFNGIDAWFNSPPLTLQQLRGKVVLVDFWTFDCINCLRHLPFVKQWHEQYRARGLVVVGVHTPEFAHERSAASLQNAIRRLQIKHPVAQDNGYATWQAFGNHFWPADYLIDRSGRLVYMHYGEGDHASLTRRIEALLAESPDKELQE